MPRHTGRRDKTAEGASGDRTWWQRDGPALLGLAAVVALLFPSAVLGRGVFYYRDIGIYEYAQLDAFARCLASGSWPLWNPYVAFGRPFVTHPSVKILYPPTWSSLAMHPWTFYTLSVIGHFVFSGGGFYFLGRRLGLSRWASFVGAGAWTACGPLVSLVSISQHMAGASWWPWMFLAADWALTSGQVLPALAWGACVAAPILALSPDTALMGGLAVGSFAIGRLQWRRPWLEANRPLLRSSAIAAVFALWLSAAQWLPAVMETGGTARMSLPAESRRFWSVHPFSLLQLVLPAPLDDLPLRAEVRAALFDSREPLLPSLYLGMSAVGLVAGAFAWSHHPHRRFAGLLGLAALLIALGRHAPVYELAATLLPPLRAVRFPAKAMVLVGFAWALLCGIGADAWRARTTTARSKRDLLVMGPLCAAVALGVVALILGHFGAEEWGPVWLSAAGTSSREALAPTVVRTSVATGLAAIVLVLALSHPEDVASVRRAAAIVGILALGDLLWAHHDSSPVAPAAIFTDRPPAAALILREPHSRVYSYDYVEPGLALRQRPLLQRPETLASRREEWPGPWAQVLAARQRLYPSLLEAWGLEGSFDRDTLGLYPSYLLWLVLGERASEGTPVMLKVLRMGSVSHVVALHDHGFEDLVPVARLPGLLVEPVRLFRVPDPFPRVYAVGGARVADGREALRLLSDPGFDPAREVILAEGESSPPPPSFSGATRIVEWRPDRMRLESRLDQPGYVVMADAYDPGWRAHIDGRSAPVLRANIGLRAVPVPAGTHVLDLAYRPRALIIGLVVSGLSLAFAAAVAAAPRLRGGRA